MPFYLRKRANAAGPGIAGRYSTSKRSVVQSHYAPRESTKVQVRTHTQRITSPSGPRLRDGPLGGSGVDPESWDCEQTWLVADGVMEQLPASANSTVMLSNVANDGHRGRIASLLFWESGITEFDLLPPRS
jgi:hypothetical protein